MAVVIRHRTTGVVLLELEAETLLRADLKRAPLAGADLKGADLCGADLQQADLQDADLRRADLGFADLSGATLIRADLSRANLRGANLCDADLQHAELKGANLCPVLYNDATRWPERVVPGFPLHQRTAAALTALARYAFDRRLELSADLYHDVPLYEIRWSVGGRTNFIQIAVLWDRIEVVLKQRARPGCLLPGPWAHLRWRLLAADPVDSGWILLERRIEEARRQLDQGWLE